MSKIANFIWKGVRHWKPVLVIAEMYSGIYRTEEIHGLNDHIKTNSTSYPDEVDEKYMIENVSGSNSNGVRNEREDDNDINEEEILQKSNSGPIMVEISNVPDIEANKETSISYVVENLDPLITDNLESQHGSDELVDTAIEEEEEADENEIIKTEKEKTIIQRGTGRRRGRRTRANVWGRRVGRGRNKARIRNNDDHNNEPTVEIRRGSRGRKRGRPRIFNMNTELRRSRKGSLRGTAVRVNERASRRRRRGGNMRGRGGRTTDEILSEYWRQKYSNDTSLGDAKKVVMNPSNYVMNNIVNGNTANSTTYHGSEYLQSKNPLVTPVSPDVATIASETMTSTSMNNLSEIFSVSSLTTERRKRGRPRKSLGNSVSLESSISPSSINHGMDQKRGRKEKILFDSTTVVTTKSLAESTMKQNADYENSSCNALDESWIRIDDKDHKGKCNTNEMIGYPDKHNCHIDIQSSSTDKRLIDATDFPFNDRSNYAISTSSVSATTALGDSNSNSEMSNPSKISLDNNTIDKVESQKSLLSITTNPSKRGRGRPRKHLST